MTGTLRDHPLLLLVVLVPLLYVLVEIGFRLGQRGRRVEEKYHEQFSATRDQAAVLLSLLLGFTLAMAVSRYDLRTQDTVAESDAIDATMLRAELLPEPARSRVRPLLHEYVDARLEFTRAGLNRTALDRALATTDQLRKQLWVQAVRASEQQPTPITALFVQSLNETFDAGDESLAALENRVPRPIWWMLGMLVAVTALLVGLSLQKRSWWAMLLPPLMFAVVTLIVADLDAPGRGLIHTQMQSLERLLKP
jgi:hypothetical protein